MGSPPAEQAAWDDIALFRVDRLDLSHETEAWGFATDHADLIEEHWERVSQAKGELFNGKVLIMPRWWLVHEASGTTLKGNLITTDYKTFLAWRDAWHETSGCRNIFAMAALQAEDGQFIVGEMQSRTSLPGRIQFPAGTPDLDDVFSGRVDLDASAFRELAEETGLSREDVSTEGAWVIVDDGRRMACMKPMTAIGLGSAVADRINQTIRQQANPEFVRVHAVTAGEAAQIRAIPSFVVRYMLHCAN